MLERGVVGVGARVALAVDLVEGCGGGGLGGRLLEEGAGLLAGADPAGEHVRVE